MKNFLIPEWIVFSFISFLLVCFIAICGLILWLLRVLKGTDKVIILDGEKGAILRHTNIKGESWKDGNKLYNADYEACKYLKNGKKLYIWNYNKPQPLMIHANKIDWMNSDTIMSTINNEIIKFILKVQASAEMMMQIIMISSIISAISGIMMFLKIFGILK